MTTAPQTPGEALSDEQIVLPSREFQLLNGKRFTVHPWGLDRGKLMLARLDALTPAIVQSMKDQQSESGDVNVRKLLDVAFDEVVELVADTLELEVADMKRPPHLGGWTFEDMLAGAEAVIDVCIVRSDGRGALPSLVGLVSRLTSMVVQVAGPAQHAASQRSQTSNGAALSPPSSGNGSGSRGRKKTAKKSSRRA